MNIEILNKGKYVKLIAITCCILYWDEDIQIGCKTANGQSVSKAEFDSILPDEYIEIMYLTTQASDDLSVCLSVCLSLSHTFDFMQLYM